MKKVAAVVIISVLALACAKVPITNRRQLNMLPENTLMSMSLTQYRSFLKQHPPAPATAADAQLVKEVGKNISRAVERFLKQEGQLKRIKNYKWEFNLVNENVVNAWCMPGGKVVVYKGILPVTKTKTGLAVVMGHEIAHAIARHGNERMSQQLAVTAGGIGLSVALSNKPQQTQDIFLTSYGVGSALGVLKYSRNHESEADKMGLIFMAMAGYHLGQAVNFWQRMSEQGGAKPPQLLSTHPSDSKRIEDIKKFLPNALKYYSP